MIDRETAWRRHADETRRAWRRLSYLERLRWLEQAKRFHYQALGLARRRPPAEPEFAPTSDDADR